jgi:hypothetical protein
MALKTICSFDDALAAHLVKGRLEAEGVKTYIADEHYIWANWSMCFALGGVKLKVLPSDALEAENVLAQVDSGVFYDLLTDAKDKKYCPGCDSPKLTPYSSWRTKITQWLTFFLFGLAVRRREKYVLCEQCGVRSRNDA